ncbi:MAG: hypothetical protein ACI80F_002354 [Natronomonas sp.]|jgi:hypothetical protein|uniref:YndJ family protein n=1 Tax=Natronomonas sp. TaxID=2184060 RepID=UPI003989B217
MTGDGTRETPSENGSESSSGIKSAPSAEAPSKRYSLGRLEFTDGSALFGAILWLFATVSFGLGPIDRALALAPLVLVPLGLGAAATPAFEGPAGWLMTAATRLQPVGAVLLAASLVGPDGWHAAALAAPWLGVTALLGLAAVARTLERGTQPLSETLIDAGLAYTNVGTVALLLYHLEVTFWFQPVIVLLTAVHFHYAGFVLPLTTGLVGRCGDVEVSRIFRMLGSVVLVGPAIIAVGISFSPTVELIGVGFFTAAVAALALYVVAVVAPARPRLQRIALTVSGLTLPLPMLLALGFVVGTVFGVDPFGLTISRMVQLHGTLNAFGFALLALVGWRLAVPVALE